MNRRRTTKGTWKLSVAEAPGGRWNNKGLTAERHVEILADQGGCCAICKRAASRLNIDHDHACCPGNNGKTCGTCTRGLLCSRCNLLLAGLEDAEFVEAAGQYLAKYKAANWCPKGHRRVSTASGACRTCNRARSAVKHARTKAINDVTRNAALNHGRAWTDSELELVRRTDLTAREVAARLGRTYRAVAHRRETEGRG